MRSSNLCDRGHVFIAILKWKPPKLRNRYKSDKLYTLSLFNTDAKSFMITEFVPKI